MAELPEAIGVFKPDTARKVLAATQAWERSPTPVGSDESPTARLPIVFRNNSGHEIPPYGIMQSSGTYVGTISYVDVVRPISTSAALTVPLINGPVAVPNGKFGTAQNGPVYRVLHDGGTYAVGDRLGWAISSFRVSLGCLLVNLGIDTVASDCLKVAFDFSTMTGQTTSVILPGNSGTFRRRRFTGFGFITDVSQTYTCWNDGPSSIPANNRIVAFPCEGLWLAVGVC